MSVATAPEVPNRNRAGLCRLFSDRTAPPRCIARHGRRPLCQV